MLTESEKVVNPPEICGDYKNISGGPLWLSFLLNGSNMSPGRTVPANGKFDVSEKSLIRGITTAWVPATAAIQKLLDRGAIARLDGKVRKAVKEEQTVEQPLPPEEIKIDVVDEAVETTAELEQTAETVKTLNTPEAVAAESEVVTEAVERPLQEVNIVLTATPQPLENNVLISWDGASADTKFVVVVADPKGETKTIKAGKANKITYIPVGAGKYEVALSDTKGVELATTAFIL